MKNFIYKNYLFIVFYLSILIGFYFQEDLLGGAKHDYLFHLRFLNLFSEKILNGLILWGDDEYVVRNSPLFYIILAKLRQFLSLDSIRALNTLSSLLLAIIFKGGCIVL